MSLGPFLYGKIAWAFQPFLVHWVLNNSIRIDGPKLELHSGNVVHRFNDRHRAQQHDGQITAIIQIQVIATINTPPPGNRVSALKFLAIDFQANRSVINK